MLMYKLTTPEDMILYIQSMDKKSLWMGMAALLIAAATVVASTSIVSAQSSSKSNSYELTESQFNNGDATTQSCSGQYCSKVTLGDSLSGSAAASLNTAKFGAISDPGEPLLDVIIDHGESNLGTLTTNKTATKVMVVKVRNYLSGGYTLQIAGDPPKYKDHYLKTLTKPTNSIQGEEQFGLNVVANTIPVIGADVVQTPSGSTSFGYVTNNYKTANMFMYKSGDVIAESKSESGQTDYTISMIVNISSGTPAGSYGADFSAVVVPAY